MITISINGEAQSVEPSLTVAQLVEQMNLTGKRIAIECNGDIVPRAGFAEQQLHEGDKLEIVTAVGGG